MVTDVAEKRLDSINPATLEKIGSVSEMSEGQVRQAVQRARKAFNSWSTLPFTERADQILAVRDVLVDRAREVSLRISRETGKPLADALISEVFTSADLIGYYAKHGARILADRKVPTGILKTKRAYKTYEPLGVVGIISPWNYPFSLTFSPLVTALFAGNTVVLKGSEFTPLVSEMIVELFEAANVHPDIVQVVTGGPAAGSYLVTSGLQKIVFTGSTATGRKVMAAAAETLTPVLMELGGKDPMVVCEDADIERAANAAVWGAFTNCGQVCTSVERVYVTEPVYDEFVSKVVEKARTIRIGYDEGGSRFDVGSMTRPQQVRIVEEHVADAVEKGAEILVGGERRDDLGGLFFEPTVLVGVTHEMKVMTDETFGPVLPIMKVKDEAEAIRMANETRYGLASSVWTTSKSRARRLVHEIRAGGVVINDCLAHFGMASLPFGGTKESGIGRSHGEEGLLEFVQVKAVLEDRFGPKTELFWYPLPSWLAPALETAMRLLYRRGIKNKLLPPKR